MTQAGESQAIVRRPSFLAIIALVGLVWGGALIVRTRAWPATPAGRTGSNLVVVDETPTIEELEFDLVGTRLGGVVARARIVVAADGRLLVHDLSSGTTGELAADLPLTQPLVVVDGGVVGVSRGSAVFISADVSLDPVKLGAATEVFPGKGTQLWLSHNDAGPAYVDRLDEPAAGGIRISLGSGVLVHGLADSGLLLGRSGRTQIIQPGSDVVVAEVPVFTKVLSVRRDVIVGIDSRCDQTRCTLIIVDASNGQGGEWNLARFRLPNSPTAELSPDATHLALFLVDQQRNLAVGVIDIVSGELRLGAILGSSRKSADVSWSRDGMVVYYIDPLMSGVVREFRPFADSPSDVALAAEFGKARSVAELDDS